MIELIDIWLLSKKLVQTIDNKKSSTTNCWYLFTYFYLAHSTWTSLHASDMSRIHLFVTMLGGKDIRSVKISCHR